MEKGTGDHDSEKAMSEERATSPSSAKKRRDRCFKIAMSFFPLVIWLLYLTGGGFLFSHIEGPQLARIRAYEREQFTLLVYQAWERGRNCNISNVTYESMDQMNVTACQIDDIMNTIMREVHQDKGLEWNFLGGVHFCLTVISTIGYGILVPKTQLGRILCIFYAIVGVPLNITLIGWVGRGIVYVITKTYQSLYNLCQSCKKKRARNMDVRPPRSVSCISVISAARVNNAAKRDKPRRSVANTNDDRGDFDSSKDCRVTSDSDGQTRLNGVTNQAFRQKQNGQIGSPNPGGGRVDWGGTSEGNSDKSSTVGSLTHSVQMREIYNGMLTQGESVAICEAENTNIDTTLRSRNNENNSNNNSASDNSDVDDSAKSTSVPIWFVGIFFIIYLCLTSLIIYYSSFVPGEWTLIDSFYFDIITILTVGFGDMFYYTKGQTLTEKQKTTAVLLSITMMILGMLMISAFLSFAVESLTLDNMKKAFDRTFVACWERLFCRKRKRKKPVSGE
ncbi:uncharacterized protein [Diadema antillarum]|uniref:uncharacterized protein n=1 Tax=Diadema antillarum TaxID=105358 RepID=UPI003A85612C